mgnify:CR=1 FL=1
MCYIEIELGELQWDEFNVEHIAKHDVSASEVEETCANKIYIDETYGGRYLLVGRTKQGRMVSIVLVNVGKNKYYAVTARDSSRGERRKVHDQESK